MRVADFFCGAGGFSEGFRSAPGFDVVVGFDSCPKACATYRANQGCSALQLDLSTDKGAETAIAACLRLQVDVVIGGPPCQGFSCNNQELHKRGSAHKAVCDEGKNRLPAKYARMLLRIAPKYVVMEEVTPFLRGPQYTEVVRVLTRDYFVETRVLNAAQYDTPQYRRRAFVVGVRRGLLTPCSSVPFHPPPSRSAELTAGEALAGTPMGTAITRPATIARLQAAARDPVAIRYTCVRLDSPSLTVTTRTEGAANGRYTLRAADGTYHQMTPLQASLLQGFPRTYRFTGSATAQRLQIGNAVPPPLARAIAGQLRVLAAAAQDKKNVRESPRYHGRRRPVLPLRGEGKRRRTAALAECTTRGPDSHVQAGPPLPPPGKATAHDC